MVEKVLPRLLCGAISLAAAFAAGAAAQSARLSWHHTFEHRVQFHALVDDDLLVVGTDRHLYGLDPHDGTMRWQVRNVSPLHQDLYDVPGMDNLLVADAGGGRFDDTSTHVLSISKINGRLLWESPRLDGAVLQGLVQPEMRRMLVVSVERPHGDDTGMLSDLLPGKGIGSGLKRKPVLAALDLDTGGILWRTHLDEKVHMRPMVEVVPQQKVDDALRAFDLNAYHPPVSVGDMVCVTFRGVDCYSWTSGQRIWQRRFRVIEDDMGLTYAYPLLDRGQLLATSNHRLQAFDPATGKRLWRSSKSDHLPDFAADGDAVYVQLGGRFFDLEAERWRWRGDFGAMAVDRRSGGTRWRFDNADDSVTNLLVLGDRVWLADEKRLLGLNRRNGRLEIRRKHRMQEVPVFTVPNARGEIVLVGHGEAAAFDPASADWRWLVSHPPPAPGMWKRLSAQLLQVSGSLLRFSSAAISITSGIVPSVPQIPVGGVGIKVISTKRIASRTTGNVGEQFTGAAESLTETTEFADLGAHYQYFLTENAAGDGVALAVVDINSGATVAFVALPADSPNIVVHDTAGVVYQSAGERLLAVRLRGP